MARIRKLLVVIPVALMPLVSTGPVSATPQYPPVEHHGTLKVSAAHVRVGEPVKVRGWGFAKRTKVTVRVTCAGKTTVRGSVRATFSGVASSTIRLPKPCRWTITFKGSDRRGGVRILKARVVVTSRRHAAAAAPTASEPLASAPVANTSSALMTPLWAGLGVLLAGGAFVGTMRIRRHVRT